ncbi:NADH-ubiquinone oxidoreductase chain G [Castellaniella defragrans 65Phen]|uniref:NADH-ubiquinone oxidoreductase chain G n=1 Tax=Castellaniella defragrans (strain DSM 12143 / CCUG 39792 / 65Phen) TaxID=1437824 RepID=W8X2B6_CASD6|nr:NADH-quinone oxidoreductase subunit NuoG [Castellaniella defragrans]CDM23467.1 NADH-ubiquinone oxidoreductase chain G [Castellaniella defragrans 65Phen]
MVELTIDGLKVEAAEGSMVIQAAHAVGLYIPHFCYHKKLSIAANCRMCLVEVEKAPKALPACATPVTNGMVVHTRSPKAIDAQRAVMEFLLINHPLDCPVCDQGGECQLQDLAVGYGESASRYKEPKRVVFHKPMGPLISAEQMQRCIHCTRCIRVGQEIGGYMEIGMLNRGEFSEITTFVGEAVESELSGNMIDVCPVGALLSKPFMMGARTWELARRRSVSPHDSVGANLVVQTKMDRVLRVVPFENEPVNECWISDRDRFSYAGLYVEDRLQHPMVRGCDGQWHEASWSDALQSVVTGLKQVREDGGGAQIGALATETATLEELALLARLTRALGSDNIDFRLRGDGAAFDAVRTGAPWLGMPIADLNTLDRALVVGSFLRKDHPLLAQRLRQAAKRGMQLSLVDSVAADPLVPVAGRLTVKPSALVQSLAEIAAALAGLKSQPVPAGLAGVQPGESARAIAASLASGERVAVLMGNLALADDQAAQLAANAQAIAQLAGGRFGFLTPGGNTVGGYLAGAVPADGGLDARRMLGGEPLKAYLVLHAEPRLDSDLGERAVRTLQGSAMAVAFTAFRSAAEDWADVMLPIAPFTETSGTFVNAEGRVQSFKGVAAPVGDTRPAWKVLRVLGNLMDLQGFDDETSESVRDTVMVGGLDGRLSNEIRLAPAAAAPAAGLERVAELPIYRTDALVRRSQPLQEHVNSAPPRAAMNAATLRAQGLAAGDAVRVSTAHGSAELEAALDDTVADGAVRIAGAFEQTAALGMGSGAIQVERR